MSKLSNLFISGNGDGLFAFPFPITHISLYVSRSLSLSLDSGSNFITIPPGFHSLTIGPVKELQIKASGSWQAYVSK